MALKGIRFFGTDFNNAQFDGVSDASSAPLNSGFAFDGLISTRWISSGQNTDGNAIYLEMNYGFNRTVNSFYVYNTNIANVQVEYWNGSSWIIFTGSNSTIIKSVDTNYLFVRSNTDITTTKVRVIGSNTTPANQEKSITLFYAFTELGQLQGFPAFVPTFNLIQDVFNVTDGRNFIIERGEVFNATITFVSHQIQNDINLANTLFSYKQPFFVWPNGGNESLFRFQFRPFRFQNIYKVAVSLGSSSTPSTPSFTNNYYKAGYNDTLNLVEVV